MDDLDKHLPDTLPDDPMPSVEAWCALARDQQTQPNPNAMTLSTVAAGGQPSSRVVLCKLMHLDTACFVFFTNYASRKVEELSVNPEVCLNFHWDVLGRQIRIEGFATRSPIDESDAYFSSRPLGSQLGAWTSDQSAVLESRGALRRQFFERATKLGVDLDANDAPVAGSTIPRPDHWGGIRVYARAVELWVDGQHRIHDRARWTRELSIQDGALANAGHWSSTRLQP